MVAASRRKIPKENLSPHSDTVLFQLTYRCKNEGKRHLKLTTDVNLDSENN